MGYVFLCYRSQGSSLVGPISPAKVIFSLFTLIVHTYQEQFPANTLIILVIKSLCIKDSWIVSYSYKYKRIAWSVLFHHHVVFIRIISQIRYFLRVSPGLLINLYEFSVDKSNLYVCTAVKSSLIHKLEPPKLPIVVQVQVHTNKIFFESVYDVYVAPVDVLLAIILRKVDLQYDLINIVQNLGLS